MSPIFERRTKYVHIRTTWFTDGARAARRSLVAGRCDGSGTAWPGHAAAAQATEPEPNPVQGWAELPTRPSVIQGLGPRVGILVVTYPWSLSVMP
jgi:hypothetical protein